MGREKGYGEKKFGGGGLEKGQKWAVRDSFGGGTEEGGEGSRERSREGERARGRGRETDGADEKKTGVYQGRSGRG